MRTSYRKTDLAFGLFRPCDNSLFTRHCKESNHIPNARGSTLHDEMNLTERFNTDLPPLNDVL